MWPYRYDVSLAPFNLGFVEAVVLYDAERPILITFKCYNADMHVACSLAVCEA